MRVVIELLKQYVQQKTSCHTSGRFSEYCLEEYMSKEDYEAYVEYQDFARNYPLYQENDNCVQVNILNDYYEITAEDLSCPAYSCFGSSLGSVCSAYNQGNNTVELNICATGNMCDITADLSTNGTCTQTPQNQTPAYAGMKCTDSNQCLNSLCREGVCVGTAKGRSCTEAIECDVGLYCSTKHLCEPLVAAGSRTPCNDDTDCRLNSGCTYNAMKVGKCTPYFSVPNNFPVFCNSTGFQPLCQSTMCMQSQEGTIGTCIPAPSFNISTTPVLCSQDSDCVGSNGVTSFPGKCRCGYNPEGRRYCDLFPGDTAFTNYTKLLSQVMSLIPAAQLPCQTTRRFQPDCLALLQNHLPNHSPNQLLLAYYSALEAPVLQDNDMCVKTIYTPFYWSLIYPSTREDSSEVGFLIE